MKSLTFLVINGDQPLALLDVLLKCVFEMIIIKLNSLSLDEF